MEKILEGFLMRWFGRWG